MNKLIIVVGLIVAGIAAYYLTSKVSSQAISPSTGYDSGFGNGSEPSLTEFNVLPPVLPEETTGASTQESMPQVPLLSLAPNTSGGTNFVNNATGQTVAYSTRNPTGTTAFYQLGRNGSFYGR